MSGAKFLLVLSVLCCAFMSKAQTDRKVQEFSIANENDVYTFGFGDKYYSNGLLLHYRFIPEPGKFLSSKTDSTKFIVDFEFSQKFYTPQDIRISDVQQYERPYAGWLYGGMTFNRFKKRSTRLMYGFELGVIGNISGAEAFQTWYHNAVGFPEPKGWHFQIPNELVLNFKAAYDKQFKLSKRTIDLISSSQAYLGSGFTNVVQRLDLRFGRLHDLNNSVFKNAAIGKGSEDFQLPNSYFFLGYGLQYTAHDITIQGSLWNDNAPHTEEITPWVRHLRIGFATSSEKSTFKLTYNWLSREVKDQRVHAFIGLELLIRFGARQKEN